MGAYLPLIPELSNRGQAAACHKERFAAHCPDTRARQGYELPSSMRFALFQLWAPLIHVPLCLRVFAQPGGGFAGTEVTRSALS